MRLKLTGANERMIPDLGIVVSFGGEFDAPDDIAASLLNQEIFEVVEEKKKKKGVDQ